MAKNIIIGIFIGGITALCFIWARSCQEPNTGGINDFKNTIIELSGQNRELENRNQQLEKTIRELQANNDKLTGTIDRLSSAAIGAGSDLSNALRTVERLRKLSEKITD